MILPSYLNNYIRERKTVFVAQENFIRKTTYGFSIRSI